MSGRPSRGGESRTTRRPQTAPGTRRWLLWPRTERGRPWSRGDRFHRGVPAKTHRGFLDGEIRAPGVVSQRKSATPSSHAGQREREGAAKAPRGFQRGEGRFRCRVSNDSFPLRFHQEEKRSGPRPGHRCFGISGWQRPVEAGYSPSVPATPAQARATIPHSQPRSSSLEILGT